MNKPLVSLIVPVYKAEATLKRCVDSIINQTIRDWELLLIDDGSPDSSGDLCETYASIDKRIAVIHKKNGGVSSARNIGLDNAKGHYISFIDADDYIAVDFLEKMLEYTPTDMVICGFENNRNHSFRPDFKTINLSQDKEELNNLFRIPYYLDTPWCKLFKSSIINKHTLRFDRDVKLTEDTLFCYEYISKIQTVVVISKSLYTYDGAWGGGSKYRLTFNEQSYMSDKITTAIKQVSDSFNTTIDDRYRGFHPSKIQNLYSLYKDVDIYNLYIKYYSEITIGDFLGDSNSPLTSGIIAVLELSSKCSFRAALELLKSINAFITTPISQIKFCSNRIKLVTYLMRLIGPYLAVIVLMLTSFWKR